MKISEVMSKTPVTIDSAEAVWQAAATMKSRGYGFLPVTQNRKVVGVVTARDIVTRTMALSGGLSHLPVSSVTSTPPITVDKDLDVEEALMIMRQEDIHRLVVRSDNGQAVGVVSLSDLAHAVPDLSIVESLHRHAEMPHVAEVRGVVIGGPEIYVG
jgi:CBS domain-containing protein